MDIKFPQRGRHRKTLLMAVDNAAEDLALYGNAAAPTHALEALQEALGLPSLPRLIEGFDVAHLGGKDTVASMVRFVDGRPDKGGYRHFTLRTLDGRIDDFAAMREIVARRYTRVVNEGLDPPDFILVDGGIGQANAAASVLASLELDDIPLAGLAKENEEIYRPGVSAPQVLDRSSPALKLLQAVRDESHRFATGLQKRKRTRRLTHSALEEVRGIGRSRSAQLLETLGSVEAVAGAQVEEVARVAGTSLETAERLIEYLRGLRDR